MTAAAANFFETGYALIPSFLEPNEVPPVAGAVDEMLSSPRHLGMSRPGNDLFPLRWNDELVARGLGNARRLGLLNEVLQPSDLKWLSAYISAKAPHSPALWWHQDWWCWDHAISFVPAVTQVAVLCYLSHTSAKNGALRVLPGSHHASAPIHAILPEPHGAAADGLPEHHPAMVDLPGQITLELRAGDAVVLDYRLLHGTHANRTSQRRDCILWSFLPAWRHLPTEIQAHLAAHPALPEIAESHNAMASEYANLLPMFEGLPASLPINRVPPATFCVRRAAAGIASG